VPEPAANQAAAYEQVLVLLANGRTAPAQDRSYPLEQAGAALQHLIDDRPFGKVALDVATGAATTVRGCQSPKGEPR